MVFLRISYTVHNTIQQDGFLKNILHNTIQQDGFLKNILHNTIQQDGFLKNILHNTIQQDGFLKNILHNTIQLDRTTIFAETLDYSTLYRHTHVKKAPSRTGDSAKECILGTVHNYAQ